MDPSAHGNAPVAPAKVPVTNRRFVAARLIALGLALTVVILLQLLAPGVLRGIDEHGADMLWRAVPGATIERRVVVVDIDEASLASVGPWPWPRQRMAELSRRLAAMGAGPQVYDIVFPDPRPGDDILAEEFARNPVVLAQIFTLGDEPPPAVGALRGALRTPACGEPMPKATGYIGNAPALVGTAGHITPRIPRDGVVRHLPALICHDDHAYPALGIAALLKAAEAAPTLDLTAGTGWLDPAWRLTHPALPGIIVPVDRNGDVRLSYQLPRRAFVSVPASEILAGRAPAELFRGAWVLIGATAFGIGDAVPTPQGGAVSGVEVHAQFIAALLDGRLPRSPRAAPALQVLVALAAIALLLVFAPRRGRNAVAGLPLIALLLALVMYILHGGALLGGHLWIGWAAPAALTLLAGILLAIVEHARARWERAALYANLASYLPDTVAAEIAYRAPSGALEARREQVTVLFADLRNFSAYCETRPAEESAALLHTFFTVAERIVRRHGGIVEEYVGDAVMALWNNPSDPARALAAGRDILTECQRILPEIPPPGLEPLGIGIGIETGIALVGSFGPAHRRTHTAMGETVTVANRLQSLTADLAEPLLLGPGAAAGLPEGLLTSRGAFLLEGLRQPRQVFGTTPPNGGSK